MENCLFCKIAAGEIPSNKAFEDNRVLAFYDIAPQAPVHIVVIPKAHIADGVRDINAENADTVAHIFEVIPQIAKEVGISDYRIVSNNGEDAGQTIPHLHFHILGGRRLGEMG